MPTIMMMAIVQTPIIRASFFLLISLSLSLHSVYIALEYTKKAGFPEFTMKPGSRIFPSILSFKYIELQYIIQELAEDVNNRWLTQGKQASTLDVLVANRRCEEPR
jgi:predicted small integral membrane protein